MARIAIITGAAKGLGLACAERFATEGYRLALVDADADGLAAAAEAIEARGVEVASIATDVRQRDACARAVASTVERFGGLDVLVNAAGVYPRRPVLDISADDWQFVFQVNVLGTYFRMVETIAAMRTRGGGRIVNVSSIDGFKAHPANAHYAASKAAVISLTRSVALEVAPHGILVNSVAPGPVATETAKLADWYAPMVAGIPTRQPIEPSEIANLIAYLSHPTNVSIAGENIVVSGAAVIV